MTTQDEIQNVAVSAIATLARANDRAEMAEYRASVTHWYTLPALLDNDALRAEFGRIIARHNRRENVREFNASDYRVLRRVRMSGLVDSSGNEAIQVDSFLVSADNVRIAIPLTYSLYIASEYSENLPAKDSQYAPVSRLMDVNETRAFVPFTATTGEYEHKSQPGRIACRKYSHAMHAGNNTANYESVFIAEFGTRTAGAVFDYDFA